MVNTLVKTTNKSGTDLNNLLNSIYLLPQWEKIKEFSLQQKYFFIKKSVNVNLFRKFSSKNMLEKYALRLNNDCVIASMDLKVYKDRVYIISFDVVNSSINEQVISKILQVAVEKSLYNTTNKEVKVSLSSKQNKLRKVLTAFGFVSEPEQSSYEKELFGETFILKAEESSFFQKEIKQMPILINK